MAWFILIVAGLLEVVWSLGLKYTHGFTRVVPSIITAAAIAGSMLLLARACRTLPISTAYSVWVGVGVVGATIGSAILFDEPLTPLRLLFIATLVGSIIGLKVIG